MKDGKTRYSGVCQTEPSPSIYTAGVKRVEGIKKQVMQKAMGCKGDKVTLFNKEASY